MAIVSFDFDSTIEAKKPDPDDPTGIPLSDGIDPRARELIEKERADGNEVIIVTSRLAPDDNRAHYKSEEVFAAAQELGEPSEDPEEPKKPIPVYFTGGEDKAPTLKNLEVIRHYDDDPHEINAIKVQNAKEETKIEIETPEMFVLIAEREDIEEIIKEIVLQELEAYQRQIQKGYVKKRNKYLTTGPQKTGGTPYIIKPKKTRSKSAPAGFGGSEE
jgi:hydroxymethylpyrimidine pyrophosphatase-like HAD family hydrolase